MQVFYASPWVPPEFIEAHGLQPCGVWSATDPNRLPVAAGACAFAQAVIRLAESSPDAAFIFSTHCDQLRRGFDRVAQGAPGRVFLFNLPATWQTPIAERLFVSELERLGRFLVHLGGQPPTARDLAEAMARYRSARNRLLGVAGWLSGREFSQALARFNWDGTVELTQPDLPRADGSIPLAVVGGPLPPWQMDVLDAIELAGGRVVVDATETGERSLGPVFSPDQREMVDCTLPELLQGLTRACLERCVDVFQRPNTRLYLWLKERLAARRVRGIVLWHFVGCDLWRAEAQCLREAFGLPVLLVEANAAADSLRRSGRIQALLESLSHGKSATPVRPTA